MPRRGPEAAQQQIGKIGVLTREVVLTNAFPLEPLIAWEADDEKKFGEKQRIVRRVPSGTKVRIEGITSRLGPMGVDYWYVCRDLTEDKKFDLRFQMLDALQLQNE